MSTDKVKEEEHPAHEHGIAVISDLVYNHFGPYDLDLWRFDGWREFVNPMGCSAPAKSALGRTRW